ncbi:Uncharacterised protein [Salmonella enterica subsp. enterica serovar Bovismorbificans]|uniref:Uncharacterized protein n=1 Tax=Salmonella enterica subsp. enterica serovar Bovismorbificans TaxID=58097 RepID=A0A655C2K9_SALET|nr:Uncharacterised protein [Salmonella enterica subsp. enterica serovar Bovismorbificans]
MTGAPATVSDNRRRFFHDRFPVRVGHIGDKHIARLNTVHFADIVNNFYRTCADTMTNGATFGNDFPLRM